MVIDSMLEDVSDILVNVAFFGCLIEGVTVSPYPQVCCLYLAEVGTHALVDVLFAPCRISEHYLFKGLLRFLQVGMFVLLDRGLFSCVNVVVVVVRGVDVLACLEVGMLTKPKEILSDDNYLM